MNIVTLIKQIKDIQNDFYFIEKEFIYKNFKCVVIATCYGYRCGYVGIPKNHQLYGKHYIENEFISSISVHGGITFSDGGENSIYPISSNLWWLGFDCSHNSDLIDTNILKKFNIEEKSKLLDNIFMNSVFGNNGTVKSALFCVNECKKIVDQIYKYQ